MFLRQQCFHFPDAQACCFSKAFSASHLVKKLHGGILVSECELQAAGNIFVENACLVTFHQESNRCPERDGINPVRVAIEIILQYIVNIEDSAV